MSIFRRLKGRYYHPIEKKHARTIKRKQLNFNCSEHIIEAMKAMATILEVPYYVIGEHLLQVGSYHVLTAMQDKQKRQALQEHLVKIHLLGDELSDDEDILRLGGENQI